MGCNCVTGRTEASEIDDQKIQQISKLIKKNKITKN